MQQAAGHGHAPDILFDPRLAGHRIFGRQAAAIPIVVARKEPVDGQLRIFSANLQLALRAGVLVGAAGRDDDDDETLVMSDK